MSEQTPETEATDVNLGVSTRTDVGGQTGTQPDASGASNVQPQKREVVPGEPTDAPTGRTATDSNELKPGVAIGDAAPSIADLQNQLCPNCHVGILYVSKYDPYALYERGQSEAFDSRRASGGGYAVECASCNFSESRSFNPADGSGR